MKKIGKVFYWIISIALKIFVVTDIGKDQIYACNDRKNLQRDRNDPIKNFSDFFHRIRRSCASFAWI